MSMFGVSDALPRAAAADEARRGAACGARRGADARVAPFVRRAAAADGARPRGTEVGRIRVVVSSQSCPGNLRPCFQRRRSNSNDSRASSSYVVVASLATTPNLPPAAPARRRRRHRAAPNRRTSSLCWRPRPSPLPPRRAAAAATAPRHAPHARGLRVWRGARRACRG